MKLVLALLLAFTANAHAANPSPFSNAIGKVTATSDTRTAMFYLSGDDQEHTIVYKAEVFKWTKAGLERTKDLYAFPAIIEVAPKNKYAVKVTSRVPKKEVEQTYRIVFSVVETKDEKKAGQVAITTDFNLPIFVAPTTEPFTKIEKTKVGNKWVFKNVGNVTYKTSGFIVDGKKVGPWAYILPGNDVEVEGENVELGEELPTT